MEEYIRPDEDLSEPEPKYKTADIIALVVVIVSMSVLGYQVVMNHTITMPTEPMMFVLGYFFTKVKP